MQSLKEIPSDNKNNVKTNGLSFFYAVRAVALAWDRFKLIKKVMNYKKKGNIIICDRYPSNKTGAMDSPRLLETKANPKGIKNKIFNSMVLQEKKLYSKMPPADIVIKLKVSLSTARQRNSQREDRDEDDFIKSRHQKSHNWDRDDVPKIIEIDTDQTLPETILALKNNIWESI